MEILDPRDRKGLVIGIANEHSLAWSAAQHFHNAGADLAVTYLNNKAKPFVEPLAKEVESPIFLPCNVMEPGQLEAVFEQIRKDWGRLDFVFHAIFGQEGMEVHRSSRRSGYVNSKLHIKSDGLSSTFRLLEAAASHSQRTREVGVRP